MKRYIKAKRVHKKSHAVKATTTINRESIAKNRKISNILLPLRNE